MKTMKIPTFDKFLSLLRNINIENLIDLNRKDIDFRDISLYIYHVKNYLSKYFFVNKNFIFNIIDSLNNLENKDINFSNKTIYLDYYKYIFSSKFVEGKNPTFDEFLSLLQNISIDNLKDLKQKYQDFSNKTIEIKGLDSNEDFNLYNMRNI
jgi:S-adenosylmethionine hydrolase